MLLLLLLLLLKADCFPSPAAASSDCLPGPAAALCSQNSELECSEGCCRYHGGSGLQKYFCEVSNIFTCLSIVQYSVPYRLVASVLGEQV